MIRKYRFGNPLNTEAVVEEFPVEKGDIPRVEVKEGKDFLCNDKERAGLRTGRTGARHQ